MIIGDSSSDDEENKNKQQSDGSVTFARHFFETLSKRSKDESLVCINFIYLFWMQCKT